MLERSDRSGKDRPEGAAPCGMWRMWGRLNHAERRRFVSAPRRGSPNTNLVVDCVDGSVPTSYWQYLSIVRIMSSLSPLESPKPALALGRYLLFDEIASGGMASVHFGRLGGPAGFSRVVAIKRLHSN